MKTHPTPPHRFTKSLVLALLAVGCATQLARANTELWIGTDALSMVSSNWSDNNNWSNLTGGGGAGPNGNDVIFGNVAAGTDPTMVTSIVDQNGLNPFSLNYTNNAGNYQTTLIPDGINVVDANGLNVGTALGTGIGPGLTAVATIVGGGSLTVNGAVTLNGAAASSTSTMTLDMSGLNGFTNDVSTSTMNIGTAAENAANLSLASNSFVNVTTLNVETTGGSNGRNGNVYLGATTNTIWANTINLSTGKGATTTLQFNNTITTGSVAIGGTGGGTARADFVLGDDSSGSAVGHGSLLLAGYLANVMAGNMTLGGNGGSDSGSGDSGVVTFDTGTFDVSNIVMGASGSSHAANASSGTFSAGGSAVPNAATLIVDSTGGGSLVLGNTTHSGDTGAGTLNLFTNCTAQIYCSITKANAAQNVATVSLDGSTLVLESATNVIGTTDVPIDNLNMTNSTLTVKVGSTATAVVTTLSTDGTTNIINIASVPVVDTYPQQFPIIQYSGAINGVGYNFGLGTLPVHSPAYEGYISNNVNASSVDLVLTSGPAPSGVDVWNGSVSGDWDRTTLNWTNSGVAVAFQPGDAVQFDDTATGPTNINLTTSLVPGRVVVSNFTLPYVFSGPGSLGGIASLTKDGSGSLLLVNDGANTFTGPINIKAGTVQFGTNSSSGSFPPALAVTNNGSLVLDLSSGATIAAGLAGTGNLTQIGDGVLTLSGSNSISGATTVSGQGSLMVDGFGGTGPLGSAAGTTVGGIGTNQGPMTVGGTVNPGDVNGIGTFTAGGNLTLSSGAIASFDVTNSDATVGNGVNDLLQVNGNLTANNNTISITMRGVPQAGMNYGVINYTGTLTGTFNPTVGGTHFAATVDSASTPNYVYVDITGSSGANLKWNSTTSGAWTAGGLQSWLNTGNSAADYFYSGDNVLFDDSVASVVTNIVIPSGTTIYPSIVTNVSSANSYTISGGAIGGSASLVKDGSSTLTLSNANSFTGQVDVYNGTLKTGNGSALGTIDNGTVIHNGATLDVFGQNLGTETVTVSGAGVGGNGAIYNSGADQTSALKNVTLAGDTTFGGTGRWDIRTSATLQTTGTPVNVTKVGTNQVSLVACNCSDNNLENLNILQGIFAIQTSSTQYGDPNGSITIAGNAELDVYALTAGLQKNIVLLDGGIIYTESGSTPFYGNLELTNNAANTGPGTGIITNKSGTTLVLNSTIGGPGNLLKTGSGTTQLTAGNTNAGATIIDAGTLTLQGTLANSTPITVNAGATFDVSAYATWSLSTGQTLNGSGTVNGGVTSVASSTIAPGSPTAVGVLTVSGPVSLGGTTTMKLSTSTSVTNDVLLVNNGYTLTLGGTLNVTLLNGAPAANDTFTLFNAPAGISGTFTATNLPALGAGLAWDTSNLANGVLSVVAVPVLHFTSIGITGTTLNISAINGNAGGQYVLLESTNLALPINQWTPVLTNNFDGSGNLNLSTNVVNPAVPHQFFLISQ